LTAIRVTHLEESRYQVQVGHHTFRIGQPITSGGDDAGPSPVELFAASLAACVAHYAGSYLSRHGLSSEGLVVEAEFAMADDRPARIASLLVTITPPAGLSEGHKARLLAVASHCTVHNTIHQPPRVDIDLSDQQAPEAACTGNWTIRRPHRWSRAASLRGRNPNAFTGAARSARAQET
jgi:putative redox protein